MKSTIVAMTLLGLASTSAMAYEFSFDRPGSGFGTGITPVGKLVWEQGLPTVSYTQANTADGKVKTWSLNTDTQLRTGLGRGFELQIGWDGYTWQQTDTAGVKSDVDGLGDSFIAVKKAIDLKDDRLEWALLGQVNFATGSDEITSGDDSYSLGSTLAYQYNDIVNTALTMNYSIDENNTWTVQAIPTLGYQFNDKWGGYSEFVFSKSESQKNQKSLATGLVYTISDKAQIDASIGLDLNTDNQRSYNGGLGFSLMF